MQTPATSADTAPDPADIVIAQAEARQRHRRRWLIVGSVVALLISYPLSLGPFVFLERKDLLPDALSPILRLIYFPIVFTIEHVPVVKHFYEWYLGIDLP